jgi:hypothetical protein
VLLGGSHLSIFGQERNGGEHDRMCRKKRTSRETREGGRKGRYLEPSDANTRLQASGFFSRLDHALFLVLGGFIVVEDCAEFDVENVRLGIAERNVLQHYGMYRKVWVSIPRILSSVCSDRTVRDEMDNPLRKSPRQNGIENGDDDDGDDEIEKTHIFLAFGTF